MIYKIPLPTLLKGLEFDLEAKQFRITTNYIFFKLGIWESTQKLKKIYLGYENSSVGGNVRMMKHSMQFKYFPLSLIKTDGSEISIRSFTQYADAKKLFTELKAKLNLEAESKYEEIQKSALERRSTRR